jgi:acyl-CoA synthetase (NDP forming)
MNTSYSLWPVPDIFWKSLFDADSIAVIGANNIFGSWGFDALKSARASTETDSRKEVYAVNPNAPEIQGLPSYKTVLDISGPVELAIIVVPAAIVPSILRQCVQKGVRAAVIISAGFAETGEAGIRLETELVKIAKEGGLRFVGPNCLGHADAHTRVASAGVVSRIKPGPLALLSQSGTLGASISHLAADAGIGLSKFVGTGNEANLHFEDYLEFLSRDKDTRIITAYIEGLREGRRFFRLSREITLQKPIVAMKVGSTGESSRAAKSHTGALAGSDAVYAAAFKQAGIIRVEDEEELCDVAVALLNQPLPRGNRVGILTMGGGFGVVTAEACEKEGLKIASLEPATLAKMDAILPPRWSHGNPVDLVGIKMMGEDATTSSCLSLLMADNNVDAVISLLPPVAALPPGANGNLELERLQAISSAYRKGMDFLKLQVKLNNKPLLLIRRFFNRPPGGTDVSPEQGRIIPEYRNHRRAARVLAHLAWYSRYLDYRRNE